MRGKTMSDIIQALEAKQDLLFNGEISEAEIQSAERQLGLEFAAEYRKYLLKYGTAFYNGHELTGITKSSRLNVVDITHRMREKYPDVPQNYYVIECTNIEEIIIWQSTGGEIYYSAPNTSLTRLCGSLTEYVEKY